MTNPVSEQMETHFFWASVEVWSDAAAAEVAVGGATDSHQAPGDGGNAAISQTGAQAHW